MRETKHVKNVCTRTVLRSSRISIRAIITFFVSRISRSAILICYHLLLHFVGHLWKWIHKSATFDIKTDSNRIFRLSYQRPLVQLKYYGFISQATESQHFFLLPRTRWRQTFTFCIHRRNKNNFQKTNKVNKPTECEKIYNFLRLSIETNWKTVNQRLW